VRHGCTHINWGRQVKYGLIRHGAQVILEGHNGGAAVMIYTTAGFRLNEPYTSDFEIILPESEDLIPGL